jgi:hypothetical protein
LALELKGISAVWKLKRMEVHETEKGKAYVCAVA